MRNLKNIALSGFIICFISCSAGTNLTSSGGSGGNFKEDLSSFRPKYSVKKEEPDEENTEAQPDMPFDPSSDVTASLENKLSQINNNAPESARGFRVQVYSGNSSDQAKAAKERAQNLVCDEWVYIDYRIPNFRVRVGNAISRIEANHILSRVKQEFPDAMVVPENEMEIKLKDCK